MDSREQYLRQRFHRRKAGGIPGVTRDATSRHYFPATSAEWTTFLAARGLSVAAANAVHTFQDAASPFTDASGLINLPVTLGTFSYQQAEAGFARKAAVTTEANGGTQTFSANLPNPGTESYTALIIARMEASASSRNYLLWGDSAFAGIRCTSGGLFQLMTNTGGALVTGGSVIAGTVRPYIFRYNRTATTITAFSDTEKLTGTWAACSTKALCLPSRAPGATLYAAHWFAANAEISDANLKAILLGLGWSPSWT